MLKEATILRAELTSCVFVVHKNIKHAFTADYAGNACFLCGEKICVTRS